MIELDGRFAACSNSEDWIGSIKASSAVLSCCINRSRIWFAKPNQLVAPSGTAWISCGISSLHCWQRLTSLIVTSARKSVVVGTPRWSLTIRRWVCSRISRFIVRKKLCRSFECTQEVRRQNPFVPDSKNCASPSALLRP